MVDKCYFAFHIGPVQDFIATARRTQDLWIGSWLLSRLSREAFETAIRNGSEPVLPTESGKTFGVNADFPNHFIMSLPKNDSVKIAEAVEKSVQSCWQKIEKKVKKEFFSSVSDQLWRRQTDNLLEVYWAVVEDDTTATARNKAQDALEARKQLRDFAYVEEADLKCSLCGIRQELSKETTNKGARKWWQEKVKQHLNKSHLSKLRVKEDGSEKLCAICAVKRSAVAAKAISELEKTDASFPSTSSIAAATFKANLLRSENLEDELKGYLQTLKNLSIPAKIEKDSIPGLLSIRTILPNEIQEDLLSFDGDLFYTETINNNQIKEQFPGAFKELEIKIAKSYGASSVDEANKVLGSDFQNEVKKCIDFSIAIARKKLIKLYQIANTRPSKYYAALMMDGDKMGAFFRAANNKQAQDLSSQLSNFASREAKNIVEQNFGYLVYAGGDDVLALLPLDTTLKCTRELQKMFKKNVEHIQLPEGIDRPTTSIGVAIAHHTAPLDLTLQKMRHAEKMAKNFYGRDALCISVLKRSGEEVCIGTHWTENVNVDSQSLIGLVEEMVEVLQKNVLSMKFAYAVASEASALSNDSMPVDARLSALKRLANRQQGKYYDQMRVESLVKKLAWWSTLKHGSSETALGMQEVAQWILLARFIANGGRDEE